MHRRMHVSAIHIGVISRRRLVTFINSSINSIIPASINSIYRSLICARDSTNTDYDRAVESKLLPQSRNMIRGIYNRIMKRPLGINYQIKRGAARAQHINTRMHTHKHARAPAHLRKQFSAI